MGAHYRNSLRSTVIYDCVYYYSLGGPPSDPIDSYISAYDITDEAIESFNWALDCTCNNNDDGGIAYEELLECIPSVLPLFDKLFADIIVDADLVQGQFNTADSNENELIDEQEGIVVLSCLSL